MSKRKYSNTLDDVESGYATDDTIPDDEYKSSGFTEEPREPRKISAPSTPKPAESGPEPSTEVMTKKGGTGIYPIRRSACAIYNKFLQTRTTTIR